MRKDDALALLARKGWASRIDAALRDRLFAELRWRTVPAGQTISLGGSTGCDFCAIAAGHAGAYVAFGVPGAAMGHILSPGWWWGGGPLLGQHRAMAAVARSDVLLGTIPLSRLEVLLDETPRGWRWLGTLSEEWVVLATIAVADAAIKSPLRRCAAQLLRLAGLRPAFCPADDPEIAISHEELAAMLALSRSSTTMVTGELSHQGLVTLGYRKIALRDPAGLARLAERD